MKVNVVGRGIIPGLNQVPPVYGVDMAENSIRGLIQYAQFKVYDARTGGLITKRSCDAVFAKAAELEAAAIVGVDQIIASAQTAGIETAVEPEAPVVEEAPVEEPVVEESVEETVEETTETVEEPVEEASVEEATTPAEEKPVMSDGEERRKNSYKKGKNKK